MSNYHIELNEKEFMRIHNFTIFVGTWNVNGQIPPSSLKSWLDSDDESPDIYAIGFQELDLSKEAFFLDFTVREVEWCEAVNRSVDPKAAYQKIAVVRLVGMMLIVLIKDQYLSNVKNIAVDTVGTGIMGIMGNKGGVSVRFELYDTTLCFINSHLAAHVKEFERRNQDFREIYNRTSFKLNQHLVFINDHQQIYWFGDLNYRITEMDHDTVKKLLRENNMEAVLKADQLRIQHAGNKVLNGYTEGAITFKPTYKYDLGSDTWDTSEKERTPAWCDRIFWKGKSIKQLSYRSHPEMKVSDHKPVSALFVSQIKSIDIKKYRKIREDLIGKLNKIENESSPLITVEPKEIRFDSVKYLEPQFQEISITNVGKKPAIFEFIKKMGDSFYCKEWLSVEPNIKKLNPHEKCIVKLKIFINNKSAFKFNSGEERLYDILVLRLKGGKDIFITIDGTYEKSCFGTPLETLIHFKAPIHDGIDKNICCRETGYKIPKELWFLINHIYMHGLRHPNLFSSPGLHSEILLIRDWLDHGSRSDIPGSIHSICYCLILFLGSTAEPLIPPNLRYACLNASDYLQCSQIVLKFPECNRNVFLYICAFLQEVLKYSNENGTDLRTLTILFAKIFFRDSDYRFRSAYLMRNVENKMNVSFVEHFLVNDLNYIIM